MAPAANSTVVLRAISYGTLIPPGTCVKCVDDNHRVSAAPGTICIEPIDVVSTDHLLGITVGEGIRAGVFAGRTQHAYAVCVMGSAEYKCAARTETHRPGRTIKIGRSVVTLLAVHSTPHDGGACPMTVLL